MLEQESKKQKSKISQCVGIPPSKSLPALFFMFFTLLSLSTEEPSTIENDTYNENIANAKGKRTILSSSSGNYYYNVGSESVALSFPAYAIVHMITNYDTYSNKGDADQKVYYYTTSYILRFTSTYRQYRYNQLNTAYSICKNIHISSYKDEFIVSTDPSADIKYEYRMSECIWFPSFHDTLLEVTVGNLNLTDDYFTVTRILGSSTDILINKPEETTQRFEGYSFLISLSVYSRTEKSGLGFKVKRYDVNPSYVYENRGYWTIDYNHAIKNSYSKYMKILGDGYLGIEGDFCYKASDNPIVHYKSGLLIFIHNYDEMPSYTDLSLDSGVWKNRIALYDGTLSLKSNSIIYVSVADVNSSTNECNDIKIYTSEDTFVVSENSNSAYSYSNWIDTYNMNLCVWYLSPNEHVYNLHAFDMHSFDKFYYNGLGNATTCVVDNYERMHSFSGKSIFVNFKTYSSSYFYKSYAAIEPILTKLVVDSNIYYGEVELISNLCSCTRTINHLNASTSIRLSHGTRSYYLRAGIDYTFEIPAGFLVLIHNRDDVNVSSYQLGSLNRNEYGYNNYDSYYSKTFTLTPRYSMMHYFISYNASSTYYIYTSKLFIFQGNRSEYIGYGPYEYYVWNANPFSFYVSLDGDSISVYGGQRAVDVGSSDMSSNAMYYAALSYRSDYSRSFTFSYNNLYVSSRLLSVNGTKLVKRLSVIDDENGDKYGSSLSAGAIAGIVIASIFVIVVFICIVCCGCCHCNCRCCKCCRNSCSCADCCYIMMCCWICDINCCKNNALQMFRINRKDNSLPDVANGNDNHEHRVKKDNIVLSEEHYKDAEVPLLQFPCYFDASVANFGFIGGEYRNTRRIMSLVDIIEERIQKRTNPTKLTPQQPADRPSGAPRGVQPQARV